MTSLRKGLLGQHVNPSKPVFSGSERMEYRAAITGKKKPAPKGGQSACGNCFN